MTQSHYSAWLSFANAYVLLKVDKHHQGWTHTYQEEEKYFG